MAPMPQPSPHLPFLQMRAPPQLVLSGSAVCWQAPSASQASVVQALASSAQGASAGRLVQAVLLRAGSQSWHALAGFTAPSAWKAPEIQQPGLQAPLAQTEVVPHDVPSASVVWAQVEAPSHASEVQRLVSSGQEEPALRGDHLPTAAAGVQASHGLAGVGASAA